MIDTGASSDVCGTKPTEEFFEEYIRPTYKKMDFSTASQKEVFSENGVRMQMAHWDVPADVVLVDDAPHLASLGARVIHGGHTFVWVNQRMPVIVPAGMNYIVILDLDGVVPYLESRHGKAWREMRYL